MKLLVLAPEAVDAAALRSALPDEDLSSAEVLVVSPAINPSGLRFWMSDSDDAIAKADKAAAATADAVRSEGGHARATTGESEPLLALQDALATFPADRIVVFRGDRDGYREEDLAEARERFGVPVTEV
jgi:glycine/D-amino acid oxidase-like deaminating enzyme